MPRRKPPKKVSLTSEPSGGGFGDLLRAQGFQTSESPTSSVEVTLPTPKVDVLASVARLSLRVER